MSDQTDHKKKKDKAELDGEWKRWEKLDDKYYKNNVGDQKRADEKIRQREADRKARGPGDQRRDATLRGAGIDPEKDREMQRKLGKMRENDKRRAKDRK